MALSYSDYPAFPFPRREGGQGVRSTLRARSELMVAGTTREVQTIEELKGLAGQELGGGQWVEITQEQVNAFADLTGDHQYIHVDPERAKQTMFGGTVAHGYLTLSLLPLLGRDREGVRMNLKGRMAVNYGLNRVRFPAPVPVGKRI